MTKNPHAIMDDLLAGNKRFLDGVSLHSANASLKKLKSFASSGQTPKAIVLCCSDARAPVEMIFDQDIGDLFVIRVAGNIIAPSLIGSVEFAASTFGTSLVLVMGHTGCGAVKATLDHIRNPESIASENIQDIISRIKPHILPITKIKSETDDDKFVHAVEANVYASVNQLSRSSRLIEDLVAQGKMKIAGAVLELETGAVRILEG